MDDAFEIPGLKIRIGLDPILGLVPLAGDAIAAAVSLYIIWEAARLGATKKQVGIMLANVAIDLAIGAVPGLGDAFDVAFKANTRNLAVMGIGPAACDSPKHRKRSTLAAPSPDRTRTTARGRADTLLHVNPIPATPGAWAPMRTLA